MVVTLKSEKNFMLYPLRAKVFVDGAFFDYFKIKDNQKKMAIPEGKTLSLKVGGWTSNEINLEKIEKEGVSTLKISSKIQNGFFIFSYGLFLISIFWFLLFYDTMNPYLGMAMLIPYLILGCRQIFQKKGMITIEKDK
ncbi:hypothetical protein [Capnocytophaga cynodegmi]|uniref:Uncharacterized protein n=1 Tax=Capnocytophaga cynodegmi TaxID=28189 RepID=A0A0B7HGA6_9FLAO|nr:hypothetical protein [Capnocytophaga cynodegmi]CEN38736.1 hypothetical protein CCYN2B_50136 [Capnocytophaga cynodegmi]